MARAGLTCGVSAKRTSWVVIAMALAMALPCLPAQSAARASINDQIEASMLVAGSVEIASDGSVRRLGIDQPEKLPPGVVRLVESTGKRWRFVPVQIDGRAREVRARMHVRVIARHAGGDAFSVALRGASFEIPADDDSTVRSKRITPPEYPYAARAGGFMGVVYVVARVGRDGRVEDAFAEQVNLTVHGEPAAMVAAREDLAKASLRAARKWQFIPPTSGDAVDDPHWSVRVPINYTINDPGARPRGETGYGEWEAYLPGPRVAAPWLESGKEPGSDAIAAGDVQMVGAGPTLLTPFDG